MARFKAWGAFGALLFVWMILLAGCGGVPDVGKGRSSDCGGALSQPRPGNGTKSAPSGTGGYVVGVLMAALCLSIDRFFTDDPEPRRL